MAVWLGAAWIERTLFVGDFAFTALEEPAGFRRMNAGEVSGGWDPLAGIARATGSSQEISRAPEEFCRALFGGAPLGADVVPIAYFTDYRCPYCRVLSQYLTALEAEQHPQVRITWHEWPVLGQTSELAARAALAAKRQDAYAPFHERLMRSSFVPTPAYLRSVSERIGLDADRLLADMQSAAIDRELTETRALAGMFGFRGTPGLVVGRTVVIGAIDEPRLRALVEREIADGPIEACRGARAR
ncbi:MAG TPA: DsbA family protein [Paracoccaceae bacterium]|nr:DsbA family protein [Paracoccaceae bacterium]